MKLDTREKVKVLISKINNEQKMNEKIKEKFKSVYKKDNPKLLKNFMNKHSSDQNVLSQVIYSLRDLGVPQMTNYKISQRLGEDYTKSVVYSFKGCYIAVDSEAPYLLTYFYKG